MYFSLIDEELLWYNKNNKILCDVLLFKCNQLWSGNGLTQSITLPAHRSFIIIY